MAAAGAQSLRPLDRTALVRILTEPRNALIKQYRRLFEIDGVELEFTGGAVEAIAEQALLRRTGARAARAILEEILLNVMYEVPSRERGPRRGRPCHRARQRQPGTGAARSARPGRGPQERSA